MTTKSKEFIENLRQLSNDLYEAGQIETAKDVLHAANTIQSMRNAHIEKDKIIVLLSENISILNDKVERLIPKPPVPPKKDLFGEDTPLRVPANKQTALEKLMKVTGLSLDELKKTIIPNAVRKAQKK